MGDIDGDKGSGPRAKFWVIVTCLVRYWRRLSLQLELGFVFDVKGKSR